MMHIYYGDGKGKTTAALGLALRWVGRGGKVVIAQFLKGADSGERVAWKELPNVTLLPVPEKLPFLWDMPVEERKNAAEQLQQLPQGAEVVVTGRNPPKTWLERADYATEMCARKHPYAEGVQARKGVEY